MKFIKLVVIVNLAFLAFACGNTATVNTPPKPSPATSPATTATPPPDAMAASREFFADKCASCHQEHAEGGIVKIEGKRLNVPALTKGHALGHTDDEFVKQISNGGKGMPPFKDKLKPEEITNMINFIRKEFQNGANSTPADARVDSLTATPQDTKKKMPMDMPKH